MAPVRKSEKKKTLSPAESREWTTTTFLAFLGITSVFYATMLIYHISNPLALLQTTKVFWNSAAKCLQYGLITTGNVRKDAAAYLEVVQSRKLTEELSVILADTGFQPVESQSHVLLNQKAPEFGLPDVNGLEQKLSELSDGRPVVVVFYLGYGCSHCVAQLLALDKDLHYFSELDADVVAISSDSSEHTAEKYKEYGEFHFPVLADVDYAVSEKWGVYRPQTVDKAEFMNHGTFIVDGTGKLIWGVQGTEPFLDNRTLLHVIARAQGLLPPASVPDTSSEAQQVALH